MTMPLVGTTPLVIILHRLHWSVHSCWSWWLNLLLLHLQLATFSLSLSQRLCLVLLLALVSVTMYKRQYD